MGCVFSSTGQEDNPEKTMAQEGAQILYTCDICGQEGFNEDEMRTHVLIEHVEGSVSCPFCDLLGTTAEEMTLHVNTAHLQAEFYTPSTTNLEVSNVAVEIIDKSATTDSSSSSGHGVVNRAWSTGSDDDDSTVSPPPPPMEITVTEVSDSPTSPMESDSGQQLSSPSSDGEQKRKRANLYLNVPRSAPIRGRKELKTPSTDNPLDCDLSSTACSNLDPSADAENENLFHCPMCSWQTTSPNEISKHVNVQHLDPLTPSKPKSTSTVSMDTDSENNVIPDVNRPSTSRLRYDCPFCGDSKDTGPELEHHVHTKHMDIISPAGSRVTTPLSIRSFESGADSLSNLCPLCGMEFSDTASLTEHVDGHFSAEQTPGIIAKLKQFYKSSPNSVRMSWLSSPVDHFGSSYGDKGWGCGYRNLQMMLSCLAQNPSYEQVLFNGRPVIPSIPKIQRLIEAAWQKGFDVQGSQQLGGKVISTTKWIGATEIVATLSSLKIKCQLIDFHNPTGKDSTHPLLFEWVKDYFSKDTDFKPPLYLQHQGHSRTIIGVEELKDRTLRLLLFDPSCGRRQMQAFLNDINANLMRSIRRTVHGMKAKQYQIVAIVGILSDKEYEESKVLKSDRIP